MMRKTVGGLAMLALFLTVGATDVAGQQGPRGDRLARADALSRRGGGAPALEGILRMRERLELTDEQVTRLDALRSQQVERRAMGAAERSELRSQLRAGTLDGTEARERMLALRETRRAEADAVRTSVEEILTEAQEAELEQLQAQRRAFQAGRRSAIRDRERAFDGPGRPGARSPRGGRGGR